MKKETEDRPSETPAIIETKAPEKPAEAPAADAADLLTKLRAENAELTAAIRGAGAREQITTALRDAGARSPGLLFDAVRGELQFADDGTLTNAAALIERLAKQFPEQFGSEPVHLSIDGGAGRVTAPALTKEALAKMTPAEIARLDWAAVKQALSNG